MYYWHSDSSLLALWMVVFPIYPHFYRGAVHRSVLDVVLRCKKCVVLFGMQAPKSGVDASRRLPPFTATPFTS